MSDDGMDFDDLLVNTAGVHPEQAQLEAELEKQKRKRALAIPTKDADVRLRLRSMGEPQTLFGERPGDRRDRLRELVSRTKGQQRAEGDAANADDASSGVDSESSSDSEKEEEFYTQGGAELLEQRRWMAQYSLKRARDRIALQKQQATLPLGRLLDTRKKVFAEIKTYATLGSQLADDRPIACTRFSPNSKLLATGSWSGVAKIWDVPSCRCLGVFKGHGVEKIGGVAWHPQATMAQSSSSLNFATGAADGNINLWSIESLADPASKEASNASEIVSKPLRTLKGHTNRVCRIAFHPSGKNLASASFDGTWRLWDSETGNCILNQEGHSKEVYAVAYQGDGALIASGGLDAIGRVWDLRSGKTAMVLDGHVRDILGMDFAPNGFQLASASNDDTVRIWDLRSLRSIYTIPAHSSTVSDLSFFKTTLSTFPTTLKSEKREVNGGAPAGMDVDGTTRDPDMDEQSKYVEVPLSGMYLATSGYDGLIKFWSADDWQLIKAVGHQGGGQKIMSVDLSQGI